MSALFGNARSSMMDNGFELVMQGVDMLEGVVLIRALYMSIHFIGIS